MITINVDDIEAALQKVKSNGGSTVMERTSIGPMGFTALMPGQNQVNPPRRETLPCGLSGLH